MPASTTIVFYEKPGCINNTRQKRLLIDAGFKLDAKNILTEPWDKERLRTFFKDLPVAQWFNRSAPAIKSGRIIPEQMTVDEALAAMLGDPLLIRRPLLQIGDTHLAGFDPERIQTHLGVWPIDHTAKISEGCPKGEHGIPCPEPHDMGVMRG